MEIPQSPKSTKANIILEASRGFQSGHVLQSAFPVDSPEPHYNSHGDRGDSIANNGHHAGSTMEIGSSSISNEELPHSCAIPSRFGCFECADHFSSKGNRDRHLKNCHPKNNHKFSCNLCSASFKLSGARTMHIRRVHTFGTFRSQVQVLDTEMRGNTQDSSDYPTRENNSTVYRNIPEQLGTHRNQKRSRSESEDEIEIGSNPKVHRSGGEQ